VVEFDPVVVEAIPLFCELVFVGLGLLLFATYFGILLVGALVLPTVWETEVLPTGWEKEELTTVWETEVLLELLELWDELELAVKVLFIAGFELKELVEFEDVLTWVGWVLAKAACWLIIVLHLSLIFSLQI
jgi:hypothetical protein